MHGEHVWLTGSCTHDELTGPPRDDNGKELDYFKPLEPASECLKSIILDKKWLQSLEYYVNFRYVYKLYKQHFSTCTLYMYRNTGALESLHSLMLMYSPKRVHFR